MDSLIFVTLAYTGLRIGELLALKWTDFDEEKGSLRITKTFTFQVIIILKKIKKVKV